MSAEASPRPWHAESDNLTLRPPVCFVVDANGAKVSGGFFSPADAALIVDAVNFYDRTVDKQLVALLDERDRLRDAIRYICNTARHALGYLDAVAPREAFMSIAPSDLRNILEIARAALGEEK